MIVAISGKAGSGKDTTFGIVERIAESLDIKVKRFSFADALKDEAWECFLKPNNIPRSALDTVGEKEQFRTLLQWLGDWRRTNYSPTWWTDILFELIRAWLAENPGGIAMICDCRYWNEGDLTRLNGGLVWRVNRELQVLDQTQSQHKSETDMDKYDFDYVIENNGDLQDLTREVVFALGYTLRQFKARKNVST